MILKGKSDRSEQNGNSRNRCVGIVLDRMRFVADPVSPRLFRMIQGLIRDVNQIFGIVLLFPESLRLRTLVVTGQETPLNSSSSASIFLRTR